MVAWRQDGSGGMAGAAAAQDRHGDAGRGQVRSSSLAPVPGEPGVMLISMSWYPGNGVGG